MARPRKNRYVSFNPDVSYFKPRGIPMYDLEEIRLTVDEREAIRLADLHGMSHEAAGLQMGVSRATFGRIIQHARQTVADALINGKAINVGGGNFKFMEGPRIFKCDGCGHVWEEPCGTGRPAGCLECKDKNVYRIPHSEELGSLRTEETEE